jgi:hypothetical protein
MYGIPVEVLGRLDGGFESLCIILRYFLAGVTGIFDGKLGGKWADGHSIRLFIAQRRDVAVQPFLVELLGSHRLAVSRLAGHSAGYEINNHF